MLPVHRSRLSVFNYGDIPAGYYFKAMQEGRPVQRFWHQYKFQEVANRISDGAKVLDFGCGPGSFLSVLFKSHPNCSAVGMDVATLQLDFARDHISRDIRDRIELLRLDPASERLPFEDSTFDVVTSIEVIEHIHPYLAMESLREMRRVLKPEGKMIITTPNYRSLWPFIEWVLEKVSPVKYHDQHINCFTPSSLVKFIESAGFEVTQLKSIFMAAPFLASTQWSWAVRLHELEKICDFLLGSLFIAEAKKISAHGH